MRDCLREKMIRFTALSDWCVLLCCFLQTPTKEIVAQLTRCAPYDDIVAIGREAGIVELDDLEQVAEGFKRVHRNLVQGRCGLTELRQEHTRLFMHPKHPEIPPYESAFLDRERVALGKPSADPYLFVNPIATDALSFYKKAGFSCSRHTAPADHVTVELEYLSKAFFSLADCLRKVSEGGEDEEALALLNQEEEALRRFEDAHVYTWMPAFFESCIQKSTSEFYRSVGSLGVLFIEQGLGER